MITKIFPYLLAIFSWLPVTELMGQTVELSGTWKGQLSQDDKNYLFKTELYIIQRGNRLYGTATYFGKDNLFASFRIIGTVSGNTFILQDISIIDETSFVGWNWCKKTYKGSIKKNNNQWELDGTWSNDAQNMFDKKILVSNSNRPCEPGSFTVSRSEETALENNSLTILPKSVDTSLSIASPQKDTIFRNRIVIVKNRIEVFAETIELNFFDNGEIDGDSISVFYNKKLIIDNQPLRAIPLTITVEVTPGIDNEILMFANNEGSIPPNTAILIFDTKKQRIELPINSNLKSNVAVYLFKQ